MLFVLWNQCSGSMTFWCGSGSADPCLWLMEPGPGSGSCYFRHWPLRCQQKTNLTQFFLLVTFWRYIYIIFQRWKVKKSRKIVGFKVFLIIFAWSGSSSRAGSGSIPLNSGSGSGRQRTRGSGGSGSGFGCLKLLVLVSFWFTIKSYFYLVCLGWLLKKLHAVFSGLECRCQRKEWRISGQDIWWRSVEKKII